jgi:ParB-like chromosome segregation protein Spo0J
MSNALPVAKTETVEHIALSSITSAHNPRNPVPNLVQAGHCPLDHNEKPNPIQLVHDLALSDDPERRAEYVRLMDQHEGDGITSIVHLADGEFGLKNRQLQAVVLTAYRIGQVDPTTQKRVVRYRIVCGERRILAMAYLYAKYGLPKYANIKASVIRATKDQAWGHSIAENFLRLNPSPSEEAFTYLSLKQDGMKTGEIAAMFFAGDKRKTESAAYQHVRSMLKLVSGKNKLTDQELQRLDDGEIGLTKAKQKAQRDVEEIDDKKANRRRCLGVRQVEELFDKTRTEYEENDSTDAYLEALADVMQIKLEVALKESTARLAEAA